MSAGLLNIYQRIILTWFQPIIFNISEPEIKKRIVFGLRARLRGGGGRTGRRGKVGKWERGDLYLCSQ